MKHSPAQRCDPNDLPGSLVDVAEALGVGIALRLMQVYGGQEVKFPAIPAADHPVIKSLGESDARALCNYLSGNRIYVPHGRRRKNAFADVKALEAKGMARHEIARLLGISQRHVRRTANRLAQSNNQPDLFD